MNNESIIRKIQALRAKTTENGATPEEAEAALNLANKLMQEYNIEIKDLNFSKIDCIEKSVKVSRFNALIKRLGNEIAETFDCEAMFTAFNGKFFFFGIPGDVEICCYLMEYLTNTLDYLIKEKVYPKLDGVSRSESRNYINSFTAGFVNEIRDKLEQFRYEREQMTTSNGTSLVLVKSEKVQKDFDIKYHDIYRTHSTISWSDNLGYVLGQTQGKNINLKQPIEEAGNKKEMIGVN